MYLTADFETNNNNSDCHVWLWATCDIYDIEKTSYGYDIHSFFDFIINLPGKSNTLYFHNLKFDGEFLLIELFKKGYEWSNERKLYPGQFTTLISDMGVWYSIEIRISKNKYIKIYDSAKIYPFKVKDLAKSFGMDISKGEIDYNKNRPIGYIPTVEEIDYVLRDVKIPAIALKYSFDMGDTKMTAGSNALAFYKRNTTKKMFEYWFPELEDCEDEFIRESYKGGWVYVNPKFKNRDVGKGIVLDVNSLFPSRMKNELMPYGKPLFFNGKYKERELYPLYVQKLRCKFEIKKNHLPTIQLKKNSRFTQAQYLSSSNGEIVELTLTNVDLELFFKHYSVKNIEYVCGYAFHGAKGMFDHYIDHWMKQKQEGDKEGNKPKRTLSKLKMNSLYGKFAKRPKGRSKKPVLIDDVLKLEIMEEEQQGKLYIPVGTFITSYARHYTISAAQKNYKRFLYSDTDSLHLKGTEMPKDIEVDAYKLGAWKHEETFVRAKYLGPKCYVEEVIKDEEEIDSILEENPEWECLISKERGTFLQFTCAGLPDSAKVGMSYEKFEYDLQVRGKLVMRHVPGGIVLEETTFKIKPR